MLDLRGIWEKTGEINGTKICKRNYGTSNYTRYTSYLEFSSAQTSSVGLKSVHGIYTAGLKLRLGGGEISTTEVHGFHSGHDTSL
jgi:hypothetical protein